MDENSMHEIVYSPATNIKFLRRKNHARGDIFIFMHENMKFP